jgi:thioredoxin-like negative regulator of GroEL
MLTVSTPAQLSSQVLTAGKALLFFTRPGCEASVLIRERLERLMNRNTSLVVAVADMSKVPGLARVLNITESPTVVLFRRGKRIAQLTGRMSARQIQEMVDSVSW